MTDKEKLRLIEKLTHHCLNEMRDESPKEMEVIFYLSFASDDEISRVLSEYQKESQAISIQGKRKR